jgi:gliding motility-associated-like protein
MIVEKYKWVLFLIFIGFGLYVSGQSTTQTFSFTGGVQSFTVPACTDSLIVTVCGAQGGGVTGGAGACVDAIIPVNSGDLVEIFVGGQGTCGNNSGGWNGGGTGHASFNPANVAWDACGGGGASAIHINGVPVVIAGAGGGKGGGSTSANNNNGGLGGCINGGQGGSTFGAGAGGGTQTAGGNGGAPWAGTPPGGQAGSSGQGGQGGLWQTASGGGGGGGFFGGGGGGNDGCCTNSNGGGGGGGGSSLIPAGASCKQGSQQGNGLVTVTYIEGSFDFEIINTSCLGASDGQIIISTDTPGSEFSFDGGVTYSPTDSILSNIPHGIYEVCVNFQGGSCSNACDSLLVEPGPPIGITVSNDTLICENGTATLQAQGGAGSGFVYFWEHTNNTNAIQNVSPNQPTTYTVVAQNSDGCQSNPANIQVNLHPPLAGTIDPTPVICPGEEIQLSGNASGGNGGPYNLVWTDMNGIQVGTGNTATVNPTSTTIYTLTITDDCESSTFQVQHTVEVAPLPPIEISVDNPEQCIPGTFTFFNDMDLSLLNSYTWIFSTGDTVINQTGFEIFVNQVGNYSVKFIYLNNNNCIDSAVFNNFFTVTDVPKANFTFLPNPPNILNTEVAFQNGSQGAINYQWFFENGNPAASVDVDPITTFPIGETGEYEVTLIAYTEADCADTVTRIVEVVPAVTIFAPNTFTPDGDLFNERWRVHIQGIDIFDFNLVIFNRWGEIVWESFDPDASWDGTYGGKRVKEGTYIWRIQTADLFTDKVYEWKGHINVIY